MTFTDGMELANNELAFAEHQNVELMAARGNQVITGVGVTEQGTPDLTVAVASGNVLAGGVVVAVSSGNIDFSTEHGALTSGQAQFGFVHVNSSGTKSKTMGIAAAAGQQLPADVPEDEVVLAQITLTEGDPTIDSVDIEDWRINVPKGGYFNGSMVINGVLSIFENGVTDNPLIRLRGGSNQDSEIRFEESASVYGFAKYDGDFNRFDIGTSVVTHLQLARDTASVKNVADNAGFYTGASDDLRMFHSGSNFIRNLGSLVIDIDSDNNNNADTFSIVKNRAGTPVTLFIIGEDGTLTIGTIADLIATTFNGTTNIYSILSETNAITSPVAMANQAIDGAGTAGTTTIAASRLFDIDIGSLVWDSDGDTELNGDDSDDGKVAIAYLQAKLSTDSWVDPEGDSSQTVDSASAALSHGPADGGTYVMSAFTQQTSTAAEIMAILGITVADEGADIDLRFFVSWDVDCVTYASGVDVAVTTNTLTASEYAPTKTGSTF